MQPPEPTTTRERILFAALELFYENGYGATSVAQILERAGVNSGSLYHFFSGKEDVLLAVLDLYLEWLYPAVIAEPFSRTEDPIERVFQILADYRERIVSTAFTYHCPLGSLGLEIGGSLPAARVKVAANFEGWRGWVKRCFDDAADRLPRSVDTESLSALVLTVMEGGVMQAQVHRSIAPFDASVAQLREYLNRLQADRAAETPKLEKKAGRKPGRSAGSPHKEGA